MSLLGDLRSKKDPWTKEEKEAYLREFLKGFVSEKQLRSAKFNQLHTWQREFRAKRLKHAITS
jgi:hypothetical protein